jgi:hypothetical protein
LGATGVRNSHLYRFPKRGEREAHLSLEGLKEFLEIPNQDVHIIGTQATEKRIEDYLKEQGLKVDIKVEGIG